MRRACRECGAEFEAKRRDQVYHSRACKWKAARRRNGHCQKPRSRREYMRAYRKSPAASAAQRESQLRYRSRPEVRSRRQEYDQEYRRRPESLGRKRQNDREQRRRRAEEQLRIDFLRLRAVLAERLEMATIIKAREDTLTVLRTLSTEDLKQQLVDRLGLTAESLLRTACLVAVLEERGEDLSGLKIGLLNHLRKIAAGKLLPEIVVQFAGNGKLINRISELAIADQRRILAGADHREILHLKAPPAPRHNPAPHNERTSTAQEQEDVELFAQRPEAVIPAGSPRDVAEYLFGLIVKHDQPAAVMGHLRDFFAEWEAGGKRRRIVLEDIA